MTTNDLTAIEARLTTDRDDFGDGYADQSIRDREALLELVRSQEAQLTAVLDLATHSAHRGWRISADDIRTVLGVTK